MALMNYIYGIIFDGVTHTYQRLGIAPGFGAGTKVSGQDDRLEE